MPISEELRLGSSVYSSDGKHVGQLDRVVVDDPEFKAEAIVVKESRLFSGHLLAPGSMLLIDELVVPLHAVASARHDRIDLSLTAAQVRRLPPYLTYDFAQPTAAQQSAAAFGGGPQIPNVTEEANKPAGEIEIDPGENVMLGESGKTLGHVNEVLVDEEQVVGIVVHPGLLEREVILPRRFLERGDDMALFARLTEQDLQHLKRATGE